MESDGTLRHEVFGKYKRLLALRTREEAFHPVGGQKIINLGDSVFALLRTSPDGLEHILAIQNVTSETQRVELHPDDLGFSEESDWLDLISLEKNSAKNGALSFILSAYQTVWLKLQGTISAN